MNVTSTQNKDVLTRTFESSGENIKLPTITVLNGRLPKKIQKSVFNTEALYFSLGDKIRIKILTKKFDFQSKPEVKIEAKPKPEVKVEAKAEPEVKVEAKAEPEVKVEAKAEPEVKVEAKAEPETKAKPEIQANKLVLKAPADSVEGQFHSFGNRSTGIDTKGSVIYMYHKNNLVFILGSNFAEHKANGKLTTGDIIKVTKLTQYVKAATKVNAQAASFGIEILEHIENN